MRRAAILFLVVTITAIAAPGPGVAAHPPAAIDFDYTDATFMPVIVEPPVTPTIAPRPPVAVQPTPIVVPVATPRPKVYGPTIADAKAYALAVLGPTQYACLDHIAYHESGWTTPDINPSSGAYGIPQAVPGSKMAWAGSDWRTNPVTQIKWMIHYVDGRYGSACQAWAFWQVHRWY